MASKNKNGETYGLGRTRNWATVIYPDSAPEDWKEIIASWCIQVLVSPLHDKDVNPDGEVKKAHWHVLMLFDGVKSEKQVQKMVDKIAGVGLIKVSSSIGYARYLIHADNPDKAQYKASDVLEFGGADYLEIARQKKDKRESLKEIFQFIDENRVYSYRDLIQMTISLDNDDWFDILVNTNTLAVKEYLKSAKWSDDRKKRLEVFENHEK